MSGHEGRRGVACCLSAEPIPESNENNAGSYAQRNVAREAPDIPRLEHQHRLLRECGESREAAAEADGKKQRPSAAIVRASREKSAKQPDNEAAEKVHRQRSPRESAFAKPLHRERHKIPCSAAEEAACADHRDILDYLRNHHSQTHELTKTKRGSRAAATSSFRRKDRDSNPGTALDGHTLSRRASSATRASFLDGLQI